MLDRVRLRQSFQLARSEVVHLDSLVAQGIGGQQLVRLLLAEDGLGQGGSHQLSSASLRGSLPSFWACTSFFSMGCTKTMAWKARSISPTGSASSLPT